MIDNRSNITRSYGWEKEMNDYESIVWEGWGDNLPSKVFASELHMFPSSLNTNLGVSLEHYQLPL